MPICKCVVRLRDSHDTEHSTVVYADSLYEAVVRGLKRLSRVGWESFGRNVLHESVCYLYLFPRTNVGKLPTKEQPNNAAFHACVDIDRNAGATASINRVRLH
jgi:hypothetical protein